MDKHGPDIEAIRWIIGKTKNSQGGVDSRDMKALFLFLVDSRDMKARLDEFAQSIDCVFMISIDSLHQGVSAAMAIYYDFLITVIIRVGLFFFVVALADLIYQKKSFENSMKMEKHEIKQEYKSSEGDPQIKGKRKQIAQEIAFGGGGPAQGTKNAKAVVANPIHLAIAIAYEPDVVKAPFICAIGEGPAAKATWAHKALPLCCRNLCLLIKTHLVS